MGLFSFLTESGRGCFAVLAKDRLVYQVELIFRGIILEFDFFFLYILFPYIILLFGILTTVLNSVRSWFVAVYFPYEITLRLGFVSMFCSQLIRNSSVSLCK